MRRKLLFLLQFLGCSLVLFTFGHRLLHGYATLLGIGMDLIDPSYPVYAGTERFLYGSSMVIIAFIALMVSTPEVPFLKRAIFIIGGLTAFFITDLLFIQFCVFPDGRPSSNEDSPVFELYLFLKLLLPFLLWIVMNPPLLRRLRGAGRSARDTT